MDYIKSRQISNHAELNAQWFRDISLGIPLMVGSALSVNIYLWPPSIRLPPVSHPCNASKVALNVWFIKCYRLPHIDICFASPCSSSPLSCPVTLTMVRRRGSCRRGGGRGGCGCSQPAPPLVIPLASASPTSDIRRPLPHNSFQTTHFPFHNHLNQPVLSASITVIFSEEEARPTVAVNTSTTQSQGESARQGEDVGFGFNCGDLQAGGNDTDVSKLPDGNQQDVPASSHPASGSDSIR